MAVRGPRQSPSAINTLSLNPLQNIEDCEYPFGLAILSKFFVRFNHMNFSAGVSDRSSEKLPPSAVSQAISPFSRKALVLDFILPPCDQLYLCL